MGNLYVIKFDNGYYWCGYNNSDKQLRKAVIYKSLNMAEDVAKDCLSRAEYIRPFTQQIQDYRIVEVELKEKV